MDRQQRPHEPGLLRGGVRPCRRRAVRLSGHRHAVPRTQRLFQLRRRNPHALRARGEAGRPAMRVQPPAGRRRQAAACLPGDVPRRGRLSRRDPGADVPARQPGRPPRGRLAGRQGGAAARGGGKARRHAARRPRWDAGLRCRRPGARRHEGCDRDRNRRGGARGADADAQARRGAGAGARGQPEPRRSGRGGGAPPRRDRRPRHHRGHGMGRRGDGGGQRGHRYRGRPARDGVGCRRLCRIRRGRPGDAWRRCPTAT